MQNNETKVIETKEQENFATEIFHEFKIHSRIAIIGLTLLLAIGALLYYKNDVDWRTLFESYDFISQEGEGINSINTGEQGDLNNEPESKDEEGQE